MMNGEELYNRYSQLQLDLTLMMSTPPWQGLTSLEQEVWNEMAKLTVAGV